VYVSGFGEKSIDLAARIGDGYVTTKPDADGIGRFRSQGSADRPVVAGAKGCWAADTEEGRKIAHRLWANESLPGELAQVLPTPEHFEQASTLVTPDQLKMPCGPDPQPYRELIDSYAKAGVDTLHISAVGPHYRELIDLFRRDILPDAR